MFRLLYCLIKYVVLRRWYWLLLPFLFEVARKKRHQGLCLPENTLKAYRELFQQDLLLHSHTEQMLNTQKAKQEEPLL